jgi:outer membrane protein assembly factor BamB
MTAHTRKTRVFGVSVVAVTCIVSLLGCGTAAFSPHFRDNTLEDLKMAMAGVKGANPAPGNSTGKPLAFIVTKAPMEIIAYDLEAKKVNWRVKAELTSRVVVGGGMLFHRQGKNQLVARSVESGEELWSTELIGGERLLGVDTDGENVYYVTESKKRSVGGDIAHLVSVKGGSGGKRWVQSSSGRLGAPVVHGGRVFVPLRFQSIAILDTNDGKELARIRSKEETLLWVRRSTGGVLFGGTNGVYKLDEKAISGAQQTSTFITASSLPKSVRPVYWWDGYNASLSGYTAYDRNRLLWQLDPQAARFQDDTIFVHNYRFFFAFDTTVADPKKSALRWAYSYPRHDVVASSHTGKALVLVTNDGHLIAIDPATGATVLKEGLKVSVLGATFDAAGFSAGGGGGKSTPIRDALTEIIWDPDRRFGAVKLFCVEELSRLQGGNISADLVKIVTQEQIDKAVYKRAGEMLVTRHDKQAIPLYLETLKSHYNFVNGTRGKAVDIMARALGDLKATEGVRPLLMHLADHETPLPAVEAIVKSLSIIGDKSVLEPFRDFLLTYRCDPMFTKAPAALNLVAETLLKLGGEDERQLLSFVENDPHTLQTLRNYLGEALRQSTSPETKPKKKTTPAKSAAK